MGAYNCTHCSLL